AVIVCLIARHVESDDTDDVSRRCPLKRPARAKLLSLETAEGGLLDVLSRRERSLIVNHLCETVGRRYERAGFLIGPIKRGQFKSPALTRRVSRHVRHSDSVRLSRRVGRRNIQGNRAVALCRRR